MVDGRRHSVDIPIAKTLVALRRVRSLRDPSTNSISKFSGLVDNVNWETHSSNGISLRFGPDVGSKDGNVAAYNDVNCDSKSRKGLVEITPRYLVEDKQIEVSDNCGSNQIGIYGQESSRGKYCNDYRDKGLLDYGNPSTKVLDGVDICNGRIIGMSLLAESMECGSMKKKTRFSGRIKSALEVGDLVSRVGSPCLSLGDDGLFGGSSRSASSFTNKNVDVVDNDRYGCGLSYCWSGTPRFRYTDSHSDGEDHPLISGTDVSERVLFDEERSLGHVKNKLLPFVENPRSISQKYRPKSFNDLVGHNVVVRSLLSAISKERTASFYIFYGPRGTGKTSASRVFAAALNCLSFEEHKPCGMCRECILFFSGKSKDIKEVDSVKINHRNRIKLFVRSAVAPPVSSRFKVFIVDECQLLEEETWGTFLNSFDDLSQSVVFVMITTDLDKLPRSAVSRSQKYHFAKIKETDIASRLEKISIEEGLEFDQAALDFVASKSNGSVRDAEMMLDQLSLLGRRITMSLAYELIGVVCDDELLELLDLALSGDTANTVRRAREMMRSRIDPMQLVSQLANLIMDVLAGKSLEGTSHIKKVFFRRHASETDMQKLSGALRILSETEKQLRRSKNQMTWLTVALLQLGSVDSPGLDMPNKKEGDFWSTSSTGESSKYLVSCACDANKSHQLDIQDSKGKLDALWKKALELCESRSLRDFLRNNGSLSSVCVSQGIAIAELEFYHPSHVTRAERSWKIIASLLQSILSCNVEIRINLVPRVSSPEKVKGNKRSFNFLGCSCVSNRKRHSASKHVADPSNPSDLTSEKAPIITDQQHENCSSECVPKISRISYPSMDHATIIRSYEGNTLSIRRSLREQESRPKCVSGVARFHRKLQSTLSSQMTCLRNQLQKKRKSSSPNKKLFEACFCGNRSYMFCNGSNSRDHSYKEKEG